MEQNDNSLNIKVTTASLLKYALPTILSGIFMNVYGIADRIFVSNILGTDTLSAVSIAGPFLAIALAIGTIIATGGCALVSNQMGEQQNEKARQNFSFFMVVSVVISTAFCILGLIFRTPILYAMGADEALYPLCEAYAVPIFMLIPFAMVTLCSKFSLLLRENRGLALGFPLLAEQPILYWIMFLWR